MAGLESNYYISKELLDSTNPCRVNWTFASSPALLIYISLAYVFIIYFAGPRFMRDKQPYSLKKYTQFYNIFQVVANFFIVFNSVTHGSLSSVWRFCDKYENMCGHNGVKPLETVWWMLVLKVIDLSETIVFILRKKDSQISYLHVYHHISTIFVVWFFLKYATYNYIFYFIALNCGMHVIMYFYYFLSTFGPKVQKKIRPYKKLITTLQMMHLSLLILPCLHGLTSQCDIRSRYISVMFISNGLVNLLFFWNFYKNAYKRSKAA